MFFLALGCFIMFFFCWVFQIGIRLVGKGHLASAAWPERLSVRLGYWVADTGNSRIRGVRGATEGGGQLQEMRAATALVLLFGFGLFVLAK